MLPVDCHVMLMGSGATKHVLDIILWVFDLGPLFKAWVVKRFLTIYFLLCK